MTLELREKEDTIAFGKWYVCVWSKKPVKIYIDKMKKSRNTNLNWLKINNKDFTIRDKNPNAITRDTINLLIK